ncbi:MAG TPA: hypothetical protein VHA75_14320 [Rugosimonospora sp.]|nr:hypothetical protein [Rugosimonospora sp.]
MGRFVVFLILAEFVVMVIALVDCLSVPAEGIRVLPRALWAILIVVLTPVAGLGSLAWFLAGRPVAEVPAEPAHANGARTTVASTAGAPDDDPDFLRSLDANPLASATFTAEDAELLRQWEADLRRREEELRRERERGRAKDEPDPPTDAT